MPKPFLADVSTAIVCRFSYLNVDQATALFNYLAQLSQHHGPCQPHNRKIEIWGNDFSFLQPQILAHAVSKLEEVLKLI